MSDPNLLRIRDASSTVVNASPKDDTPSNASVSVLNRRRDRWATATDVPHVHIDN